MTFGLKSLVAVAAVAAFASVSVGAAKAGDCKNGHANKGYVTKNFNQPAKATLFTLSARKRAVARKRRK